MAGATAYEGAARAEGADTAAGRAEAAQRGGNMAVGQSVSNSRAERIFYADSRARRYGAVPLRSVPFRSGGRDGDSPDIWESRHPHSTDGFLASSRNPRASPHSCRLHYQCRLFCTPCSPFVDPSRRRPVIPKLRLEKSLERGIST